MQAQQRKAGPPYFPLPISWAGMTTDFVVEAHALIPSARGDGGVPDHLCCPIGAFGYSMQTEQRVSVLRQIPSSVWVLGCVSLFMDVSSEIIHSLLPMFLMASLGASATTIGIIEGIAEATASIVKVFSGTL